MARNILGVAFGPGLIQVAEIAIEPKSAKLLKAAEFKLDAEALKAAIDTGKKFGEFLRQNKFTAKIAVAGLPTQWLMIKEKSVPPMSADNLAGMLRLQAERDFSLDPQDLALDYTAGEAAEPGARPLLVVATLRERIEQIETLLKAAGLVVRAVTSSALALADASGADTLLTAGPFGAELIVRSRGNLRVPSILSSTPAEGPLWIVPAAPEARRTLAMRAIDPAAPIVLWNGSGKEAGGAEELSRTLKMNVRDLRELPGLDIAGVPNAQRFGHAVALALLPRSAQPPAVNFLDSKLIERDASAFANVRWWMAAAALLAVALIGWLSVSWYLGRAEVATLKKQAENRKTEADATSKFVATYAELDEWHDKRTYVLECMKELSHIIPNDGTTWLSNLSVEDDFRCVMSAKTTKGEKYYEVLEKIEKNQRFRDVRLVYMVVNDTKKSEVSFAISFIFWKR